MPISRLRIARREEGDYLTGSPLLLCNDEEFSSIRKLSYDGSTAQLVHVLEDTFHTIHQVYLCYYSADSQEILRSTRVEDASRLDLSSLIDSLILPRNIEGMILQTCALASRIFFRTLELSTGFGDDANGPDMRSLYENLRFIGVKGWAGLPYVYVWLYVFASILCFFLLFFSPSHSLLVGFASSTPLERPFFIAALVRSAFSYGCYQIDVFGSKFSPASLP